MPPIHQLFYAIQGKNPTGGRVDSVEPLVVGIELGKDDDQNFHVADRPVPDAGRDENTDAWPNRQHDPVQLEGGPCTAFQDVIGLGQAVMVMNPGISGNLERRTCGWISRPRSTASLAGSSIPPCFTWGESISGIGVR